ncbi:hypothetical protein Enr13x_01990 [Stieleria neptunia]|uniref:Uncharacterized protein n=1 Tax=Stieleria neptunia TaxID=2527979 RepID=A0A518HHS4_9BACT|nr:hypothetical protein Enr13x_01990 [Stieleria neptunia]
MECQQPSSFSSDSKRGTFLSWLVPVVVFVVLFVGNVYAIPEVLSDARRATGVDARRAILFRYFHLYAVLCFASSLVLFLGRRFNRFAVVFTTFLLFVIATAQVAFHWSMVWFWDGVEAGL